MDSKITDFLTKSCVCALTTLLKDGMPHAAALHYSHTTEPFEMYFSTENTSRKCEALLDGGTTKGAVVVGLSEEEWITLQMDGEVVAVTDAEELKKVQDIHYAKHPSSAKYKDDPATIFLKFMPTWWRYSDYNTKPMTVLSSE